MLTVLAPGARTLIQDLGRPGYEHLGVPTSGAADPGALRLANRLVGNRPDAPALEVTLTGPMLRATQDTVLAYAGPPVTLHIDDRPVPDQHTLVLRAGQTLRIGALHHGVYGYLAVGGGLAVAPVLGSCASCTLSGLGPAPLAAGDTLAAQGHTGSVRFRAARRTVQPPRPLRFLPGPHAHLFSPAAHARLAADAWTISAASSRVGVRFTETLPEVPQDSIPSMGMVPGAIQVPPTGTPILLGPDHGTTGGYPLIGVLDPADLPALLQRRPGEQVRLTSAPAASTGSTVASREGSVLHLDRLSA